MKKSNKKIIFKVQSQTFNNITYFLPNQGVTLLASANILLSDTSYYNIEGFQNYNKNNSNKLCNIK